MAGTKVESILLTAGQNEGIERAVLPTPQLSSVLNMRLRRASRWGKRFGHTAISTTNLGTGTGLMRAVGGGKGSANTCFALVDDQCNVYNQTAGAFVAPASVATFALLSRVSGAASGWLPDTSFFPVPAQSPRNQTTTPCGGAYAFGYLWTVIQYTEAASADRKLRIVATDPNDQTVVRVDDFSATTAGFGGNNYPKLVVVGSTLILTYSLSTAGVNNIVGRSLANIGAVWSGETVLTSNPGAVYDASSYDGTRFLVGMAGGIASSVTLFTAAFAISATQAIVDSSGNPLTEITVVGAGAEVYVGYACAATPSAKVRVYTTNLAGTTGTATVSGVAKRPLLALLSGGGVRVVYSEVVGAAPAYGVFLFRDVSAAAVAGANQMQQNCAYPISLPFTVGSTVYMWVKTEIAEPSSYASLIRLPAPASFAATATISCPIELSTQDYLVSSGQGIIETDARGLPVVTRIGTTAAYTVPVPTLYSTQSTIAAGHDFRVLQAKHYSDTGNRRAVQAIYADSSAFLPMGALTRVDDRGAAEEGFIHPPTIGTVTPAVGAGALTPLSDYYYTAIYRSRNSNGRSEVSAPATPVKVTMGAGQNQNSVLALSLGLTARNNVTIEVYRTLSNGQTFYLAAVLDSSAGYVTLLDQLADTAIATQQALYTQVGQTLANAFPPPSRFGCAGGQRLFLGGLVRPDIVQASKLIFGDQSPSFTDSDAFRIVLPAACTGIAWMDTLCMFTTEGIYIASGDGPDDSGVGDFGTLTRMPYEIGCIEPRSVIVVDDGCFFQTARGLYLLPRGFGAPIPAGDNVQTLLSTYNVITGCAVVNKLTEQVVHWCVEVGTNGGRIVYDLAHKAWSIDVASTGTAVGIGQWLGGEVAQFTDSIGGSGANTLVATNDNYTDNGFTFTASVTTGDLRPFGVLSEGSLTKIQLLAEVRSASSLLIRRTTEVGNSLATRIFALAANDYQVGQLSVTDVELGAVQAREVSSLRVELAEISSGEGLAYIALALEHEQGEGLKRASPLSRVT